MRIMLRPKALMLLGICLLWGAFATLTVNAAVRGGAAMSGAGDSGPRTQVTAFGNPSDWLLCPELLEHAHLKVVWQQMLPVNKDEVFATVALLDDRLYVRSSSNYLWSLDAAKGDIVFSRPIASRGIPVLGLDTYGDTLISVVGNRLTEYSEVTGAEQRVSDLEVSIVAMPVRNGQFFYVAAADRRLHALRADDLVRMFKVSANNDSLITTICADENTVVFGTGTGNVIAMAADAPKKLWEFKAAGAIAGSIVPDGTSFYFASKDTNVYRIDMTGATTVDLTWRFQTEAVLDRAPRVTEGFVYQYAIGRGLTAVNKQTGRAVWSLPEGVDLLAEARNKAYVITKVRTLAVMDNATGKMLYSLNCAPVIGHAANTEGTWIYVTDDLGRVACLEPVR